MADLLIGYCRFIELVAVPWFALTAIWLGAEKSVFVGGVVLLIDIGLFFLARRVRRAVEKAEGDDNG